MTACTTAQPINDQDTAAEKSGQAVFRNSTVPTTMHIAAHKAERSNHHHCPTVSPAGKWLSEAHTRLSSSAVASPPIAMTIHFFIPDFQCSILYFLTATLFVVFYCFQRERHQYRIVVFLQLQEGAFLFRRKQRAGLQTRIIRIRIM